MTVVVAKLNTRTRLQKMLVTLLGVIGLGVLAIAYHATRTQPFWPDAGPIFLRTVAVAFFCFVIITPVVQLLLIPRIQSRVGQAAVQGALVGAISGWTGSVAMLGRWVPEADITIALIAALIVINIRAAKRDIKGEAALLAT